MIFSRSTNDEFYKYIEWIVMDRSTGQFLILSNQNFDLEN